MPLGVIILAAGRGRRMHSALPKVLHCLAGKPLLQHVIDRARALNPSKVVIVHGHGGDQVMAAFAHQTDLFWVQQVQQLGTGHAVQQALPLLTDEERVLVLYGDVPLTHIDTLRALVESSAEKFGLLTVMMPDASGYGRIVRDAEGRVIRIVEQNDAKAAELAIQEANTGILCVAKQKLAQWLSQLSNENAQGEYYLTDIVELAAEDGETIVAAQPTALWEAQGVNDRVQLSMLEQIVRVQQAEALMRAGVTLHDPTRFDLRGVLQHGHDIDIDVNVIVEGSVTLGNNVCIGANSSLRNVTVGNNVQIKENCVIEDAQIGDGCTIGPFARLRPGANLIGEAHIGNFVEIKKATIGFGSKVNHLSYVGDSEIGARVNIGAGTITCNYDGANKHTTVIGDDAFIGSNTALVAPVTVGSGATIGAGSVISRDAPDDKLTLTRAKQVSFNWHRPEKKT